MKLNYRRTFFIGMAFLAICAFWQMYDNIIPLMLEQTFHMNETVTGVIMAMDNVLAVFLLPVLGTLSDKVDTPIGKRMPFIIVGTVLAAFMLVMVGLANRRASLVMFIIFLFLLLIAMGLYRSPAVALMPDLTPKPLRSQGNAVINLMGAIGGVYALILISLLTGKGDGYMPIIIGVVAIMLISLVVLLLTIREKKTAAEVAAEEAQYEAESRAAETENEIEAGVKENIKAEAVIENTDAESGDRKPAAMDPAVKKSLTMILLSIALWYIAYNGVTTAWSRYATRVWHMEGGGYANCLMVGTVVACLSYIPIGILAAKIGRKKSILLGIVLLFVAFGGVFFYSSFSWSINIFFVLVGIGWAAINVNSLPMVVEMCDAGDVGKYTGLYYTFSMSAQIITPIVSGALLQYVSYRTLFPYACFFMVLAFITMSQVKHGDNRPEIRKNKLEYMDVDD